MLKVIIVDDEQFIAQGLQALIDWNAAGYEVAAVLSDGQEALEYIKKLPVDLVITDVMMPKMTGLELLETVRRENLSNAGFVILSGYSEFSYAQKALRYGCIDYLLKPVEKQDLLSILSKYNNISRNSKMEEQYELAYQARCLISLLFGKYDPHGVDYLHKHLDFSDGVRYIEISACHSSDGEDLFTAVRLPEMPAVPKHSISRIFIRNWVFRHNTNCDFWLAKKWTISPLFLNRMIPSAG